MATRLPFSGQQFLDANGDPLAGGLLTTYLAGTTSTLRSTYTTAGETTALSNPIVLDANGYCPAAYGKASYYYKVKNAADTTTYYTEDNVKSSSQGIPALSVLTSTQTYTVPAGARYLKVTCIGGGGGGAGSDTATDTGGGGGGSGGTSTTILATVASSYTVTIGAGGAGGVAGAAGATGGTTSFGSACVAIGGLSGQELGGGGLGGTTSGATGDVKSWGFAGHNGSVVGLGATYAQGGAGGGAGGGMSNQGAAAVAGAANSGGGGQGGYFTGATEVAGGAGGSGVVIVEYFI